MDNEIKDMFKTKQSLQKEKWEEIFEKAKSSALKNNYRYALHMLDEVVQLKPDLYEAHMLMRVCERRKTDANPPSIVSKIIRMIKIPKIISSGTVALNQNKPLVAIKITEKALHSNPYNPRLLSLLAEAMLRAGMIESAIGTYESILEFNKKNTKVMKKLGELYSSKEDYKKARNYLNVASRLKPNDDEILFQLKKIDAHETIQKGRWEESSTGTFRTSVKDTAQATQIEREEKIVRTESDIDQMIKYYEEKLKSEPSNPTFLRTLGDLYVRAEDYDKAVEKYQAVLKIDKTNLAIIRKIGDVNLKKIELQMEKTKEKLKKSPNDPFILKQIEALKKEVEATKLKEAGKRAALYPTDPSIRFEYGVLLFQNKNYDKAIAEFQTVVPDPARRVQALHMLGVCFREKGMNDLAVAQFERALENMTSLTEEKKELIYDLGITLEKMKKYNEATEQFKKIFEVDIGYKDVAKKIEEAYKSKDSEK